MFFAKDASRLAFAPVCSLYDETQRRKVGFGGIPCSPVSFLVVVCTLILIGANDQREDFITNGNRRRRALFGGECSEEEERRFFGGQIVAKSGEIANKGECFT